MFGGLDGGGYDWAACVARVKAMVEPARVNAQAAPVGSEPAAKSMHADILAYYLTIMLGC